MDFSLQNNENVDPAYAEVVKRVSKTTDHHSILYYPSSREGKYGVHPDRASGSKTCRWLFSESMALVSPGEISKTELNSAIYGRSDSCAALYEILGFKQSEQDRFAKHAKEYESLSDDKKKAFFELELQRRFGITTSDLEKQYQNDSAGNGVNYSPASSEFPVGKVKNWDSLKKHVAEMLIYATPVEYAERVRSIRVSKSTGDVMAYLLGLYRVDGSYGIHRYFCQMCHKEYTKASIEHCQIETHPELELDPMNLCLCANCAGKFRAFRNRPDILEGFLERIRNLKEDAMDSSLPVKISIENQCIWFVQTHAAEIAELWRLQKEVEQPGITADNSSTPGKGVIFPKAHEQDTIVAQNPYHELIGKEVLLTS